MLIKNRYKVQKLILKLVSIDADIDDNNDNDDYNTDTLRLYRLISA